MKNASGPKNSSGTSAKPDLPSPGKATGTPHMPRVGGHTTNNAPGQGVSTGPKQV